MTYTEAESQALSVVSIIMSIISLGCCLFIIFCWIVFEDLRKLAYAFVFYMAIATTIRQFSKTWGGNFKQDNPFCTIQGFLMVYGGLSTFYWIMSIALIMYTMIFHPFIWRKEQNITKYNKISLVVNYSVPLLFALLPVFTDSYAPTGGWCWISGQTTKGKIFRWVSFYGQLVVILTFCIFAYCRIYFYLKFSKNASDLKNTHKMYNRIKFYPLCLVLGFSVAMIRRFIELWDVDLGFGWAMATSVTTGLFGFFLLMVYGRLGKLSKLFKAKYAFCVPICDKICCCLGKHNDVITENETTNTFYDESNKKEKNKSVAIVNLTAPNKAGIILSEVELSEGKLKVLQESAKQINEHNPEKETIAHT